MTNSEIKNLKRLYKFYVVVFIFVIIYSFLSYFWAIPFVSVEFVIGMMFLSLLGAIIYLGSMIIELDRRIEKIENIEKND